MTALVNTVLAILGIDVLVALVLYFTFRSIRNGLRWAFRRRYRRRSEVDAAVRRHPAGRAR